MPEIKINLTNKERDTIKRYASADGRTMSNLCRKALIEKVRRDRKTDWSGEKIYWPHEGAV